MGLGGANVLHSQEDLADALLDFRESMAAGRKLTRREAREACRIMVIVDKGCTTRAPLDEASVGRVHVVYSDWILDCITDYRILHLKLYLDESMYDDSQDELIDGEDINSSGNDLYGNNNNNNSNGNGHNVDEDDDEFIAPSQFWDNSAFASTQAMTSVVAPKMNSVVRNSGSNGDFANGFNKSPLSSSSLLSSSLHSTFGSFQHQQHQQHQQQQQQQQNKSNMKLIK